MSGSLGPSMAWPNPLSIPAVSHEPCKRPGIPKAHACALPCLHVACMQVCVRRVLT